MDSWLLFNMLFCIHYQELSCETVLCKLLDPCICSDSISGESCTLDCTEQQASCRMKTLKCRDADPCIINCRKRRSCQGAFITCPANNDCIVNCIEPSDTCDGKSGGAFNITLNGATTYQCIDGIGQDRGVCPPINEWSEPYVPSPFTLAPTAIPTAPTRNPTTNEPTSTSLPTTTNPTTDVPTTNEPTISPVTPEPITANPTRNHSTINPSTLQPTSTSPTSPTIYSTLTSYWYRDPTTNHPSSVPTAANPTMTPSTSNPTLDPTLQPTIYCTDWEINVVIMIAQYQQTNNWKIDLQQLLLNVFQRTVLLQGNGTWYNHEWCVNIHIQITSYTNRRALLQNNDIDVYIKFTFNDVLYDDYFAKYNITEFSDGFLRILTDSMGSDVDTFVVLDPIQVTDAPAPTYPPRVLETRKAGHNRSKVITVVVSIFGVCCCCVTLYTCRLWYKYESDYEHKYNLHVQHRKYRKVEPNTPSVPGPTTIEMDTNTVKNNDEMNSDDDNNDSANKTVTAKKVDELSLSADRREAGNTVCALEATRKSIEIHLTSQLKVDIPKVDVVSKNDTNS